MLEFSAFNAQLKVSSVFGLIFPVDSWKVFGIYGGEKVWQRTCFVSVSLGEITTYSLVCSPTKVVLDLTE